jgi:hypothetical protein
MGDDPLAASVGDMSSCSAFSFASHWMPNSAKARLDESLIATEGNVSSVFAIKSRRLEDLPFLNGAASRFRSENGSKGQPA